MVIEPLDICVAKAMLLLTLLGSPGWCQDHPYQSISNGYSIRFSSEPRLFRVDGPRSIERIGDDTGLSIAVYEIPGGSEAEFWKSLVALKTDSMGAKLVQEWVKVDNHRALKLTSYPNSRVLPIPDAQNKLRIREQVLVVKNGKVFDLLAFLDGKNEIDLKRRARRFWSSFTFL